MSLFRKEVLDAKRGQRFGRVVLIRPISFTFLAGIAVVCAGIIIAFLCVGTYTKRVRVTGILIPDLGLIKVMAPSAGIIVDRRVKEGQIVKAGDILFVISSEHVTTDGMSLVSKNINSNQVALETIRDREKNLRSERSQHELLEKMQFTQLERQSEALRAELSQLNAEISLQDKRIDSGTIEVERIKKLVEQHFISNQILAQKQDDLLDQQGRSQGLRRDRIELLRQISSSQSDLSQLPTRSESERTQITSQLSELEQAGVTAEAQSSVIVTAPTDGVVTAILAEPGQTVSGQPLLTILPSNARLEAQLYVPSRAAGFIEPGQAVNVRFDGYPYQKFGQYRGVVISVSRAALSLNEIPTLLAGKMSQQGETSGLYRVKVGLNAQFVMTYGKRQYLSAGMLLEADVMQDKRTLIEWVLEPLSSLKG